MAYKSTYYLVLILALFALPSCMESYAETAYTEETTDTEGYVQVRRQAQIKNINKTATIAKTARTSNGAYALQNPTNVPVILNNPYSTANLPQVPVDSLPALDANVFVNNTANPTTFNPSLIPVANPNPYGSLTAGNNIIQPNVLMRNSSPTYTPATFGNNIYKPY